MPSMGKIFSSFLNKKNTNEILLRPKAESEGRTFAVDQFAQALITTQNNLLAEWEKLKNALNAINKNEQAKEYQRISASLQATEDKINKISDSLLYIDVTLKNANVESEVSKLIEQVHKVGSSLGQSNDKIDNDIAFKQSVLMQEYPEISNLNAREIPKTIINFIKADGLTKDKDIKIAVDDYKKNSKAIENVLPAKEKLYKEAIADQQKQINEQIKVIGSGEGVKSDMSPQINYLVELQKGLVEKLKYQQQYFANGKEKNALATSISTAEKQYEAYNTIKAVISDSKQSSEQVKNYLQANSNDNNKQLVSAVTGKLDKIIANEKNPTNIHDIIYDEYLDKSKNPGKK